MLLILLNLDSLLTQVKILAILLSKDGANQPIGRVLFNHLACLYRVVLNLRPRLIALRLSKLSLILCPRCSISPAKTTLPLVSSRTAIPVFLLPGSSLTLNSLGVAFKISF